MTMIDGKHTIQTDDPRVDELVTELVSLKPVFNGYNDDHERSCQIIAELDEMKLSISQRGEVIDFIRLQWQDAAQKAEQNGLFSRRPIQDSLNAQISSLYAIRAGISLT